MDTSDPLSSGNTGEEVRSMGVRWCIGWGGGGKKGKREGKEWSEI